MRVAIIGGTGLVGRHLAAALLARGDEPIVVARRPGSGPRVGTFRAADVEQVGELEAALEGCEAIVSCFGSMQQPGNVTFRDVHVRGLSHLVSAARARGIRRMVHLSALSASSTSKSAWLRAKHGGEQLLGRGLVDVTILRPTALYGPGDGFVVPLAALLRKLPVAPLPGAGRSLLQPTFVGDVVHAIAVCLARPDTAGAALDLAGPEVLTLSQIYDRVMEGAGIRRPKVHVPYAIIEPASHLWRAMPGIDFSFDQLSIIEEERPGDPQPAAARLDLRLERFTPSVIRRVLAQSSEGAARASA